MIVLEFEKLMENVACDNIGFVGESDEISIKNNGKLVLSHSVNELRKAWKGTLDGGNSE